MIKVGIVGASGYGGLELMRWLFGHPKAEVVVAQSSSAAGKAVTDVFPSLAGQFKLEFTEIDHEGLAGCDLAFLAVDNGNAACLAQEILATNCKVIDLSADHRFRDAAGYELWYGVPHPLPNQTRSAVYGLPELHAQEIARASLVGNPGCYATATILGLAPLLAAGLIESQTIVVDGKSGVSGAGRSSFGLGTHFSEVNEAVTPYKVGGTHRHTGEIEQELSAICRSDVKISFTPHLVPMTRGALVSCYGSATRGLKVKDVDDAFKAHYGDQPLVRVVSELPSSKHTLGSARCHMFPVVDERTGRISVFSALDNLGKGMATQAIQNMNLTFGLPQQTGLMGGALWP